MPYRIRRRAHDLIWVVMEEHVHLAEAERYYHEMWRLLDQCPKPTDLLVDGRRISGADRGARQRTEAIVHHKHLGRIAFIVSEHHLLIFAPLVRFVSGIGLFATEQEALRFLGTVMEYGD